MKTAPPITLIREAASNSELQPLSRAHIFWKHTSTRFKSKVETLIISLWKLPPQFVQLKWTAQYFFNIQLISQIMVLDLISHNRIHFFGKPWFYNFTRTKSTLGSCKGNFTTFIKIFVTPTGVFYLFTFFLNINPASSKNHIVFVFIKHWNYNHKISHSSVPTLFYTTGLTWDFFFT